MKNGTPSYVAFVKDPVWKAYIYITELEQRLIDSFPVQRLRRIRQLAGSEFVYPGACHTRFEHSLGVMHLGRELVVNSPLKGELDDDEKMMIELAALLHDVGHGPFSHVFESLLLKMLKKTHEDLTSWIIRKSEVADLLRDGGFDPLKIGKLAVGNLRSRRKPFLDQIIRGPVDVDKLDFVVRDSYHTGAGYGFVDVQRILLTMDVVDGKLAVNVKALPALEAFILARLESFRAIYFHRAVRAAQLMLETALNRAEEELNLTSFTSPEEYLELDDYTAWTALKRFKKSEGIIRDLERRQLLKCAYEVTFFIKDEFVSGLFASEAVRNKLRDEVAKEAKVDPEEVFIDVPVIPSVPYDYLMGTEVMDIPLVEVRGGEKRSKHLEEVSTVITALRTYMNVIRVYTKASFRERVAQAARKVFGEGLRLPSF